MKNFEERLKGGHPNSLGNTVEIVEEVLQDRDLFDELFNCYFSDDEVVRLRVSNAMKKIGKVDKTYLTPYIDRFINEISKIDQASTQWTFAQLFLLLEKEISDQQKKNAIVIMKHNLEHHNDWIVLNQTMETLFKWSKKKEDLKVWLHPHLERLSKDERKSVSKRALKYLDIIQL
ncbi:hypothetical protein [Flammeovirga aprica]|uniref:HEAT repeat domain-containing protein n=1 Tax=Flammeovirga aprica JL-4 TaxID=694437 RepID=A0A7X9RUB9_9BACT|nr:hypothetical protein [Flammeovirga aprica]NME68856.1 hypothetical protein [Flammeovirga aprica JL-4]